MDASDPATLIDALEDVLVHTTSLARSLDPAQADLPTECPGWTVRDQLSHIVALEQLLHGAPNVEIELPALAHVSTDFDRFTEVGVHARRFLPLSAIADELTGLLPRRIGALRDRLAAAGGDPEIDSPFGKRPMSKALPIRVFDTWAHEQDIRRAVGQAVRADNDAAEIALRQSLKAWSITLPQVDGIAGEVTFHVVGGEPGPTAVRIGEGGSTASITADAPTFAWLATGRGRLADAPVEVSGDEALLAVVAEHLAITP